MVGGVVAVCVTKLRISVLICWEAIVLLQDLIAAVGDSYGVVDRTLEVYTLGLVSVKLNLSLCLHRLLGIFLFYYLIFKFKILHLVTPLCAHFVGIYQV